LGGAIQSPEHSISREGGDGWALFGRVFERVSESLLKGSGALMAVVEHLFAPIIGGDDTFDAACAQCRWRSATRYLAGHSRSRAQPDLPHRRTADRTDRDPENVSDGRIARHYLPLAPADRADSHRTVGQILAEIHLVPTDGSSRHTHVQQVAAVYRYTGATMLELRVGPRGLGRRRVWRWPSQGCGRTCRGSCGESAGPFRSVSGCGRTGRSSVSFSGGGETGMVRGRGSFCTDRNEVKSRGASGRPPQPAAATAATWFRGSITSPLSGCGGV
jgi:hypothetical protein